MKGLQGLNARDLPASSDVDVYEFGDLVIDVDLCFPDDAIRCENEHASGAVSLGTVAADGRPQRGTCRTLACRYDENAWLAGGATC